MKFSAVPCARLNLNLVQLRGLFLATFLTLVLSACATTYTVTPVPVGGQKIHYQQGIPTTYSDSAASAVQVTPYGVNEDGRLVFGIALFNKGATPANLGVENLSLAADAGAPVKVLTYDEMVREAKNRATWAEIGLVLGGVATAAAASANAYSTTSGSISGAYGTTSFYARTYDAGAAYSGSIAAGAATGYGISQIENSLDNTLVRLKGQILQTTTVDPGTSFGGTAISDSLSGSYPHNVSLTVSWGADQHTFQFVATKNGQAAPAIPAAAIAPRMVFTAPASSSAPMATSAGRTIGVDGSRVTGSSSASAFMSDPHGVFVQTIFPQTPAAMAGIQRGDIIVAFNGQRVESMDDLNRYSAASAPGSSANLSLWRNRVVTTLIVKF